MAETKAPSGRHFTEAARHAAALARKVRRESPRMFGSPELFIVRSPVQAKDFAWEIRRFGGIVLASSQDSFATSPLALEAGQRAIEALQPD